MPEYLAPGVYVEEVPSANKPIQAASTSTAGMVGMTARGPVGEPTLVSSRGAYARVFGGDLDPRVFTDGRDALPYAAEGFFANGGSRLYVVRVVGKDAKRSQLALFADLTGATGRPRLALPVAKGATTLILPGPAAPAASTELLIIDGEVSETVTVSDTTASPRPLIGKGLRNAYAVGDSVTPQTLSALSTHLAKAARAGATTVTVDDSAPLMAGTTYLVGDVAGGSAEFVTITTIDNAKKEVTFAEPLKAGRAVAETFSALTAGTSTTLADPVAASAAPVAIRVARADGITAGGVIRLDAPVPGGGQGQGGGAGPAEGGGAGPAAGGGVAPAGGGGQGHDAGEAAPHGEYAFVSEVAHTVGLTAAVTSNHPADVELVAAVTVLTVHARYPGSWGDALRVSAAASAESAMVSTRLVALEGPDSRSVRVDSAIGLYPGSVVVIDESLVREVTAVDTGEGTVAFADRHGMSLAAGATLVSQEFSLTVERVERGRVAESETFQQLSLVAIHPRYAPTVVGGWDARAARPSASGASNLIRIEDNATETTRLRPLVTGFARFLRGGSDDLANVDDDAYIGVAAEDPAGRSGIQALENEPTVSIVAVPGRTSLSVQKALTDHCERMRYRFAVLDAPIGAGLTAARAHRQNFDTTRAGVYYPALEIADRFGPAGQRRIIPPSGHVLGIFARTDVSRGVHKAPANEVVRGVLAFDQKLDKAAQDMLNPLNLNCLRDFRTENRGLRVYGARVATSDPEWRYVNVRRLFLFIEQSLDTGLQWAVFEPNSEQLWATVKQSVTSFLTTVWRSGALEGTKPEEAFYVNVGYDITMTQDDIDNGRLIIEIGAAPVKPAEFVVIRISQKTREASS